MSIEIVLQLGMICSSLGRRLAIGNAGQQEEQPGAKHEMRTTVNNG